MTSTRLILKLTALASISFAIATSARAAPPNVADYRYVRFNAEKIRDDRPGSPPDERKTIDIHRTKYFGQFELFFIPNDYSAPVFLRSRFNIRRRDHSFKEIDSGFREMLILPADLAQKISSNITARAAAVESTTLDYMSQSPQPPDSILLVTADELQEKSNSGVSSESDPTFSGFEGICLSLSIPLQSFKNPTASFSTEHRVQVIDMNFSQQSKSALTRNILYGSANLSEMDSTAKSTLSRLLKLSSCADSFEASAKAPRPN